MTRRGRPTSAPRRSCATQVAASASPTASTAASAAKTRSRPPATPTRRRTRNTKAPLAPVMPTAVPEIAFARRAVTVAHSIFKTRKVLLQERRDFETLLAEVAANLAAVRSAVHGDVVVDRWGRLGQLLDTHAWRKLS